MVTCDAEPDVGAQRAKFGLLAHVPRQRGAGTVVDVVGDIAGEAGLRRFGAARADRGSAGAGIVFNLHTQIPAQLDAGVGAGNVVEAVSVQAADFDILNAARPSQACRRPAPQRTRSVLRRVPRRRPLSIFSPAS